MAPAVVWLLDRGAAAFLAVSLGSLRYRAPAVWREAAKVVIDCGLTSAMREFLASAHTEGVFVVPADQFAAACGSVPREPGILPMRLRIRVARIIENLQRAHILPPLDTYLVCDTDTVFLRDFLPPPLPGDADVEIMQEWDVRGGNETPMLLVRQSSFAQPLAQLDLSRVSTALDIPLGELLLLPTYNTGVLGLAREGVLVERWEAEYGRLCAIEDADGRLVFSRYAAEQNALSLAIYRGGVRVAALPRCFNQFPPRPPHEWPRETAIAHFVTFGRNHREARYRLWFEIRDAVARAGWMPEALLPTIEGVNGL